MATISREFQPGKMNFLWGRNATVSPALGKLSVIKIATYSHSNREVDILHMSGGSSEIQA